MLLPPYYFLDIAGVMLSKTSTYAGGHPIVEIVSQSPTLYGEFEQIFLCKP